MTNSIIKISQVWVQILDWQVTLHIYVWYRHGETVAHTTLSLSIWWVSKLAGALSPVNHRGLHQGWTHLVNLKSFSRWTLIYKLLKKKRKSSVVSPHLSIMHLLTYSASFFVCTVIHLMKVQLTKHSFCVCISFYHLVTCIQNDMVDWLGMQCCVQVPHLCYLQDASMCACMFIHVYAD